jgi:hypothetical protein
MDTVAASALVRLGIPLLSLAVAALVVSAVAFAARARPGEPLHAALGAAALLAVTAAVAASGALTVPGRPPRFLLLMAACSAATVGLARSSLGARLAERLPLAALVGFQAFRFPLELVMHRAATDGVMPIEMSFSGYNFDIVTGVTALVVGLGLRSGKVSLGVVRAWNVLGSVLLAAIVGIAFAALPWVHAFGAEHVNTWVLHFPYVWLPTVLVQAALFGHLLVFRRLATGSRRSPLATRVPRRHADDAGRDRPPASATPVGLSSSGAPRKP